MSDQKAKPEHAAHCDCCCCSNPPSGGFNAAEFNRRAFIASAGTVLAAGSVLAAAASSMAAGGDTARPPQQPIRLPLVVQPVFHAAVDKRKEATSWRWSGAIHTEAEIRDEEAVIRRELSELAALTDSPVEVLPLVTVNNLEQAAAVTKGSYDVMLIYAARRDPAVVNALAVKDKWNLMFVRHRSGPLYYMYIGAHGHVLRGRGDKFVAPGLEVNDVVVDDYDELRWRLRALSGLKNTLGKRLVVIGRPGAWGRDPQGPSERAKTYWKLDFHIVPYDDLSRRIQAAQANSALLAHSRAAAEKYLGSGGVSLETKREFVDRAFVLTEVFRDLLDEFQTDAITIQDCMGAVMPVSGTTACMPLSILNDEGYLAYCESDFVCIPAGILLRQVAGTPFFFCNPSMPHKGIVTTSHCTAPRKMDGKRAEPVRLLTHYESDFGAAPKVEMKKGQTITVVDADFAGSRWLGFRGEIIDTPYFPVCRTQLDIRILGEARLLDELRGWHWMLAYGDHLREVGYAVKKVGIDWLGVA